MAAEHKTPEKARTRGHNLAVLVKRSNGVPMEEALAKADKKGLVIASNKRLGRVLVGREEWRSISEVFPCWSGTLTAYDKPDQKLGKAIEYTDSETGVRYVFPVPQEHRGKKNVVLVVEHPDFTLETDGKTRIVQAKKVGVVSGFPVASETIYLGDAKYDIPIGMRVDGRHNAARYLWRIEKRVGLVACDYRNFWYDYGRRYVGLSNRPSDGLGVAIEAADANVASDIAPFVRCVEQVGGDAQLSVREENGKLIVAGTPKQIAAAAKLLEQLKVKK